MKNQNVLQEEAATCLTLTLLTHELIGFIVTSSAYTVPIFSWNYFIQYFKLRDTNIR